ncbi:N-formylglutamate amidohydrolase [Pseudoruegeria sp. SHC-113]|uniref:N-formylglutamate amidohydrolase n=1 Tax=Pseudoruegeria sp. SHC-113 TaxID=2855439 RepID=UPI0021BB2DF0|nr:N-formylglutamate amidohydrolase [Pseudoruegeria sp. SHC-113]MCT8162056.1 N-formylglutamate amidohydrolase [Pseudoruegeria sp. SHC-113]
MDKTAYDLTVPVRRDTSVIFASPHSGRHYPWAFQRKTVLDERTLRSSEDAFVDVLFSKAPEFGAPLLAARMPRAFVDLNRSADELDPAVVEGVRRISHNPRIASGLGVIPRVVAQGRQIYRGKMRLEEAHGRIADYWRPYHDALQQLLNESRARFGEAILIDCHSMPHEALDVVARRGNPRPDVVLGDRFGAAADAEVVDRIEEAFVSAGLRVSRNSPFAGAFVTQHYGRPSSRQHVVQIEIDRSLYMNEEMIRPNGNFQSFRRLMGSVTAQIADMGRRVPQELAAE